MTSPESPDMTHAADTPAHGTRIHEDPIEALLEATNRLSDNVVVLSENLTVQSKQRVRLRNALLGIAGIFVLVAGVGYYAVNENHDNQVQSCENANETRAANRLLWNYILDVSSADAGPERAQNLKKIKDWVNVLYAERDCTDLSRVYEVPPPPDLSQR